MTPLERLAAHHPDWIVYEPLVAALLDVVRAGDERLKGGLHDGPCENIAGLGVYDPYDSCEHHERAAGIRHTAYAEARAKLDALIQERFPELPEPVPPS